MHAIGGDGVGVDDDMNVVVPEHDHKLKYIYNNNFSYLTLGSHEHPVLCKHNEKK